MVHKYLLTGIFLSQIIWLVACGQKGDLYLPVNEDAHVIEHASAAENVSSSSQQNEETVKKKDEH